MILLYIPQEVPATIHTVAGIFCVREVMCVYQNGMMNNLICLIDDGIIYQMDSYNKVPIGRTNAAYDELAATTEEYYNRLVELGVIVPPKTQEEINAELQQALKDSQAVNMELLAIVKSLKEGISSESANAEPTEKPVSGNATKPRPSRQPSAKADAGEVSG